MLYSCPFASLRPHAVTFSTSQFIRLNNAVSSMRLINIYNIYFSHTWTTYQCVINMWTDLKYLAPLKQYSFDRKFNHKYWHIFINNHGIWHIFFMKLPWLDDWTNTAYKLILLTSDHWSRRFPFPTVGTLYPQEWLNTT